MEIHLQKGDLFILSVKNVCSDIGRWVNSFASGDFKPRPFIHHWSFLLPLHKRWHVVLHNVIAYTTVYPKKYAHGFCFAVLCCGYTLTDFPISIRLTSLALWQSNDCPSASKATLMNMDKYFMWIHYERLHNHNKAKHNKTVCIFLGIYCIITFVLCIANKTHFISMLERVNLQWFR